MKKYSKQRELILKILDSNRTHPSADMIYDLIKKELPNISLATVYRNLNMLSDDGIISRLEGVDGIFRFDADIKEHYHYICNKCGQIFDIPINLLPEPKPILSEKLGIDIDIANITFRGTCKNCSTFN